ncbi:hypothetical protein HYH03_016328 [Edaphochlamys debaryana]|uniref:Uncharacterized protein n=1 Tax=Edaphochlamys debaryana TaxID=47281 RepID=A0A835XKM0_9CHLO|nr:hypothetical protein HYH03_016328 [Edaphochlamys debaryana]|eukprot:KAG2484942.1 hypothetical protein HYH03_016328 [Edaphochlamys debaryana]
MAVIPGLPNELSERIAAFLPHNVVPLALRLTSKAAATYFSCPAAKTVHLSHPCPPAEFAARWGTPGAAHRFPLAQRRQLVWLTAATGDVANLAVAVAASGVQLNVKAMEAAAAAGQLEACRWLLAQGCPLYGGYLRCSLAAAAARGRTQVCAWLLAHGPWTRAWVEAAVWAALRGGHLGTMRLLRGAQAALDNTPRPVPGLWVEVEVEGAAGAGADAAGAALTGWTVDMSAAPASGGAAADELFEVAAPRPDGGSGGGGRESGGGAGPWRPEAGLAPLVAAAAEGCELRTLVAFWQRWEAEAERQRAAQEAGQLDEQDPRRLDEQERLDELVREEALAAAAGSPTQDWLAKVEFLEARGCPRTSASAEKAAQQRDALARLRALQARGYRRVPGGVGGIGRGRERASGSVFGSTVCSAAAGAGNTEALEWLLAPAGEGGAGGGGARADAYAARDAAANGHRSCLEVLVRSRARMRGGLVVRAAARAGRLDLVEWILDHLPGGVALDADVLATAAHSGSVPLLQALRARGCPWDHHAWAAAADSGSVPALEWLREGGCPVKAEEPLFRSACAGDWVALSALVRLGLPLQRCTGLLRRLVCLDPLGEAPRVPVLEWLARAGAGFAAEAVAEAAREWWTEGGPVLEWAEEQARRRREQGRGRGGAQPAVEEQQPGEAAGEGDRS